MITAVYCPLYYKCKRSYNCREVVLKTDTAILGRLFPCFAPQVVVCLGFFKTDVAGE